MASRTTAAPSGTERVFGHHRAQVAEIRRHRAELRAFELALHLHHALIDDELGLKHARRFHFLVRFEHRVGRLHRIGEDGIRSSKMIEHFDVPLGHFPDRAQLIARLPDRTLGAVSESGADRPPRRLRRQGQCKESEDGDCNCSHSGMTQEQREGYELERMNRNTVS